jgi:hypothetical protein
MSKKVVSLRPARKEGAKDTPKPLTLADIAITWTEGQSTWETRHYVTGQTLARLVRYLRYRNPNSIGHDPLGGDVGLVPTQLRGLAYVVFPDAGSPTEQLENDVRYTLSEYLDDLAARINAADGAEPAKYAVHVGPIPAEWTK